MLVDRGKYSPLDTKEQVEHAHNYLKIVFRLLYRNLDYYHDTKVHMFPMHYSLLIINLMHN